MSVLSRWRAHVVTRKALVAVAERRFNYWTKQKAKAPAGSTRWHYADHMLDDRRVKLSRRLVALAEARRVVIRHTPDPPLRLLAWHEMDNLIGLRVSEVGGNNRGVMVEAIIRADGGVPGEPWCGDTVAYCYLRAGAKSVVRAWASVSWLNRLLMFVARPKRGNVVIYKFDHTGLFDRWAPEHGPGWFWAGEGNTGDTGAQSDSQTGTDGVKRKLRHISQVAAFRAVRN